MRNIIISTIIQSKKYFLISLIIMIFVSFNLDKRLPDFESTLLVENGIISFDKDNRPYSAINYIQLYQWLSEGLFEKHFIENKIPFFPVDVQQPNGTRYLKFTAVGNDTKEISLFLNELIDFIDNTEDFKRVVESQKEEYEIKNMELQTIILNIEANIRKNSLDKINLEKEIEEKKELLIDLKKEKENKNFFKNGLQKKMDYKINTEDFIELNRFIYQIDQEIENINRSIKNNEKHIRDIEEVRFKMLSEERLKLEQSLKSNKQKLYFANKRTGLISLFNKKNKFIKHNIKDRTLKFIIFIIIGTISIGLFLVILFNFKKFLGELTSG